MNSSSTQATFFGLNLSQLRQDWSLALTQIGKWPVLSGLSPSFATRVKLPDGGVADLIESTGDVTQTLRTGSKRASSDASRPRFSGFLLPDQLVLWHAMDLPKIDAAATQSAIEIQARNLSPFAPDDVIWASRPPAMPGDKVWVAIASRKLIAQHLALVQGELPAPKGFEVWIEAPESQGFWVVEGYGEKTRKELVSRWRAFNYFLLFLLLAIGFAALITPTLQLRNRALQAAQDYAGLQSKTAPIMAQRELFLKQDLQVKALQSQMETKVDLAQLLPKLTKLVPDDTFLSSLKVQGAKVTLAGETPIAATLMQQIGSQPGIKDVRAPSAAIKPRGSEREIFNIEFTLHAPSVPSVSLGNAKP